MKNSNIYAYLSQKESTVRHEMKELIISAIKENGGRIKHFYSEDDEIDEEQFPIISTLYGKSDNPNILITDVYIDEINQIFADGLDQQYHNKETEFLILPDQYSDILYFISVVLGWNNTLKFKTGDVVYWIDPDNGISSGIYKILDDKNIENENLQGHSVLIGNQFSQSEVPVNELYAVSEEQYLSYHYNVEKKDCNYCEDWRAYFSSKQSTTFCPDCGKLILIEHDEEIEFNGQKFPVRTLETEGEYCGYKVATEELLNTLYFDSSPVSDIAADIDETIFYYLPMAILGLPEKEIIGFIISNS